MKIIIALTLLLILSSFSHAAPVWLHFQGTVKANGLTDQSGVIAAAGINVGSSVNLWWVVDFEATGTFTRNNGTIGSAGGFFTQIYSGDQLEQLWVDPDPLQIAEYNKGYIITGPSYQTEFIGGSGSDHVGMRAYDPNPLEPNNPYAIGGLWEFYEYANTETEQNLYFADVSLTEISNVEPSLIPIPTTAWLFGSALAGLLVARRKNKK